MAKKPKAKAAPDSRDAQELVQIAVSKLIPYARNSRTHSEEQVAQIAGSIAAFGFINPVLMDEKNVLIAGHGRLLAAQRLSLKTVPAIILRGLSETEKRALVLADNRIALNAGWDYEMVRLELEALAGDGFDVDLLGFDDGEFPDPETGTEGLTDPDDVPPIASVAVTVSGDVWLLGKHRLRCGDSTVATDVSALLAGAVPHLMVTDPPYGVEYDANWRNERARTSKGMGNRAIGAGAVGKVMNDDRADWREAWALFPGHVAYVWCASLHNHEVAESIIASGFELRSLIIWAKQQFAISRSDYHWKHEPCWYAVRKGATGHWNGDRKQTTLWEIDKPQKSETGHSTQKPIECMKRPIENNSKPGDAIYEPFSGSGTTIIAAEMTGRACYAMELSPLYVDMAVRRWQEFTGQEAVLEDGGKTFEKIESKRAPA